MTLKTIDFESGTLGATMTAATSHADFITGFGMHSETYVAGYHGNLAGQFQTTAANSTSVARISANATNVQMAGHSFFKVPTTPSTTVTFHSLRYSSGYAFSFTYSTANKVFLSDSGSAHTLTDSTLTLSLNTWYRLEWVATVGTTTTGKVAANIYAGDSATPLNVAGSMTGTNLNIGTNPLAAADIGIINQVVGTIVLDNVELNNGATTEIGPPASSITSWSGSAWVPVRAWSGTAWVPVRAWSGTAWAP